MAAILTNVNALSILALKVKENVFDLSSFLRNISIRDQVLRARLLARDLFEGAQLVAGDHVLVVGAGAAGLAAAHALLDRGCNVVLAEKGQEPLGLWKNVTRRFVGPHMYEWPSPFYASQIFPAQAPSILRHWVAPGAAAADLNFVQTPPIDADTLRGQWIANLQSWPKNWPNRFQLIVDVDSAKLKTEIRAWRKDVRTTRGKPTYALAIAGTDWFSNKPVAMGCPAKLLFIAAGFGSEDTNLRTVSSGSVPGPVWFTGQPFWADDDLVDYRAGISGRDPVRVAVFGGGDGALQDTLRALTGLSTPLDILAKLPAPAYLALDRRLSDVAAIERQHEIAAIWDNPRTGSAAAAGFLALHAACKEQAAKLASDPAIPAALVALERPDVDRVDLVVRESYFSKSYMLNRFLVLLFEACASAGQSSKLRIHWSETAASATRIKSWPLTHNIDLTPSGRILQDVNVISVRLGLVGGSQAGQYLGLTRRDTRNRRELAAIGLPFSLLT